MTWQTEARALGKDQRRKVQHCGTDRTAYISNSIKGVHLFCFRCKERLFEPHSSRTLQEVIAFRQAATQRIREYTGMPRDSVPLSEAPDAAIAWLLRGGLAPETAESNYGMRWHDHIRRVLIPVYDVHRNSHGIIGRAVFNERPKYLVLQGSPALYFPTNRLQDSIIIVEDVLSAIAIERAGYFSVAMLGTTISQDDAISLSALAQTAVLWTDPDKAGVASRATICSRLELSGIKVREAFSAVDPKLLRRQSIQEIIEASKPTTRIA